jgi:hypothetical protein
MFLYYGMWRQTPEMKKAWGDWFASIGDKLVDGGNPLGQGFEVSDDGTNELPLDNGALTGYSIISAESMEAAVEIAEACPRMTSVRVYEAVSM